MHFAKRKVCRY